jgi:hypothetical protein
MLNERNYCNTNNYHMGTIKEVILDLGKPIRRLINNIRMSWRWAKLGWNDRDFDFIYIYKVMKFKIDNMEKAFIKYGYHAEPEYNLSRMRLASKLIEKVSTEFYEMEYWDYIYDENHNRIDNIDIYLEANKHNYRRCDKIFSSRDGLSNFKTRNFKEACAMDIGYYKQKKAKRILFKLLEHRIDWWWD